MSFVLEGGFWFRLQIIIWKNRTWICLDLVHCSVFYAAFTVFIATDHFCINYLRNTIINHGGGASDWRLSSSWPPFSLCFPLHGASWLLTFHCQVPLQYYRAFYSLKWVTHFLSIYLSGFLNSRWIMFLFGFLRDLGRGLVTEAVQKFIWDHCITKAVLILNHFTSVSLF